MFEPRRKKQLWVRLSFGARERGISVDFRMEGGGAIPAEFPIGILVYRVGESREGPWGGPAEFVRVAFIKYARIRLVRG